MSSIASSGSLRMERENSKFEAPRLLVSMVSIDRLGKMSGRGFYVYQTAESICAVSRNAQYMREKGIISILGLSNSPEPSAANILTAIRKWHLLSIQIAVQAIIIMCGAYLMTARLVEAASHFTTLVSLVALTNSTFVPPHLFGTPPIGVVNLNNGRQCRDAHANHAKWLRTILRYALR